MKTFQIDLPTMYGDHHVQEVRRIMLALPGIDDLYASSSFRILQLSYDDNKIKTEEILARLEEAGYLGELQLPQETNLPVTEKRNQQDFRHTAAFEHTKQVSFHRDTAYSERVLWPCPGMGLITKDKMED